MGIITCALTAFLIVSLLFVLDTDEISPEGLRWGLASLLAGLILITPRLVFEYYTFFFIGLALIAVGIGLLAVVGYYQVKEEREAAHH